VIKSLYNCLCVLVNWRLFNNMCVNLSACLTICASLCVWLVEISLYYWVCVIVSLYEGEFVTLRVSVFVS